MFRKLFYCVLYFLSSLALADIGNKAATNFLAVEDFSNGNLTSLTRISITSHAYKSSNSKCTFDMDTELFNASNSLRARCCNFVYQQSKSNWIYDEVRLSDLLRTLKLWRCSEFEQECGEKTFAFTDFTKLVYLRFCKEAQYLAECQSSLQSILSVHVNRKHESTLFIEKFDNNASVANRETTRSTSLTLHEKFLNMDREKHLGLEQREMPCVQSILIDTANSSFGNYFEMIDYYIPFCEIVWCGFTANSFEYYILSYWNCLPNR